MAATRAFLAIPLDRTLLRAIGTLQDELAGELPHLRRTRPETLHLTLRFFAAATQETLEKIKASMLSVETATTPFEVRVRGLGAFPRHRRPRVLWLGLEPPDRLQALYASLQESLSASGIAPEERPFRPHLTIGRFRQHGPDLTTLVAANADRDFGTLPVDRVVLYESRLHSSGAEHLPLFSIALGNGQPLQRDRS